MSRRNQVWLGIGLIVIAVNLLLQATVIQQQDHDLETLRETTTSPVRSALSRNDQQQRQAARLRRQAADLDRMIQMRVPHVFDLPAMAEAIARGIHDSGLKMQEDMVFRAESTQIGGVNRYDTRIRLAGPYPSLKAFLAYLQNRPEITVMEDVRFSRSEETSETVVLTLTLSVLLKGNANG